MDHLKSLFDARMVRHHYRIERHANTSTCTSQRKALRNPKQPHKKKQQPLRCRKESTTFGAGKMGIWIRIWIGWLLVYEDEDEDEESWTIIITWKHRREEQYRFKWAVLKWRKQSCTWSSITFFYRSGLWRKRGIRTVRQATRLGSTQTQVLSSGTAEAPWLDIYVFILFLFFLFNSQIWYLIV